MLRRLLVILPSAAVGAVLSFFWVQFVQPNRKLCDDVCDITGRIAHEDTGGDTTVAKEKQRQEFWVLSDRVKHSFPLSSSFPKAVSDFAKVLEYTADPDVKTATPPAKPFGAAQADLLKTHDEIEAAAKHAQWTLWQ